jgi:hypothetical protein
LGSFWGISDREQGRSTADIGRFFTANDSARVDDLAGMPLDPTDFRPPNRRCFLRFRVVRSYPIARSKFPNHSSNCLSRAMDFRVIGGTGELGESVEESSRRGLGAEYGSSPRTCVPMCNNTSYRRNL